MRGQFGCKVVEEPQVLTPPVSIKSTCSSECEYSEAGHSHDYSFATYAKGSVIVVESDETMRVYFDYTAENAIVNIQVFMPKLLSIIAFMYKNKRIEYVICDLEGLVTDGSTYSLHKLSGGFDFLVSPAEFETLSCIDRLGRSNEITECVRNCLRHTIINLIPTYGHLILERSIPIWSLRSIRSKASFLNERITFI